MLALSPVLSYPNFDKPSVVHADTSLTALGAVLIQLDAERQEHPVADSWRTLKVQKRNYTVTERECLSVIYAHKQLRVYLKV